MINSHESPPDRFGTEPVIGWRVWFVDPTDAILWSPRETPDSLWLPGEPYEARCWVTAIPQHPSPNTSCGHCGVYAWKDGLAARIMYDTVTDMPQFLPSSYQPAYGQVALWGRVIEHEDGWRGQLAYPHLLRVGDEELARRLYQSYGVEAEVV